MVSRTVWICALFLTQLYFLNGGVNAQLDGDTSFNDGDYDYFEGDQGIKQVMEQESETTVEPMTSTKNDIESSSSNDTPESQANNSTGTTENQNLIQDSIEAQEKLDDEEAVANEDLTSVDQNSSKVSDDANVENENRNENENTVPIEYKDYDDHYDQYLNSEEQDHDDDDDDTRPENDILSETTNKIPIQVDFDYDSKIENMDSVDYIALQNEQTRLITPNWRQRIFSSVFIGFCALTFATILFMFYRGLVWFSQRRSTIVYQRMDEGGATFQHE